MRRFFLLAVFLIFQRAECDEICHFRQAAIPRNELRLTELSRILEFRCNYELAHYPGGTVLFAERFKDGKRIARYRLSHAPFDETKNDKTGIISIGWHRDAHNLVSVHDNGYFSPWPGIAHLPTFNPVGAYYFADSSPEERRSEMKGSTSEGFPIYPVLGICGAADHKGWWPSEPTAQSLLTSCKRAGAKEVIIVYIFLANGGDDPPLKYDKQ